jgi:asparagine synthase (glutamine-hydrolysing)
MCGICGIVDLKYRESIDRKIITKMAEVLTYRGPDGCDNFQKENLAFGFTRLSIIDLETGMQPLTNENDNILLVCNGEIFNYKELKKDLEAHGHKFKTKTDVEVLLHLYEEHGKNLIDYINGQFAFAIYDFNKKQLFCARDHVGIAPFFYTIVDNYFIFASEIKAILKHPLVKREIDLVALDQLMTFPGIISPRTMFKNINSLENGHFLIANKDYGIKTKEYWDLTYPKSSETTNESESYYIEKLDEIISDSVKLRLRSDVPVGFYISGGLDSSLIASKIKNLSSGQKRHSFSIDFENKNISEAKYQEMMSSYVNSIHHKKMFGIDDIEKRLKKVIYHSETPLKETYNTASMALSELVRDTNIKVILTGEGADELFAGYVGYRFDQMRSTYFSNDNIDINENQTRKKLWNDESFFYEKDYFKYADTKKSIYSNLINENFNKINCLNHKILDKSKITDIDLLHKRSYIDFKLRLPEHLLADHGDRMSFSNSVEARYPFLDINLIEFAKTIPPNLKLKNLNEKYILKKAAQKYIPKEIIKRPKFAFVAPGSSQLLKHNYDFFNDMLSFEKIKKNGYFNPIQIENLKKQYTKSDFKLNLPYDSDMLIIVITFNIFLEEFNIPNLT